MRRRREENSGKPGVRPRTHDDDAADDLGGEEVAATVEGARGGGLGGDSAQSAEYRRRAWSERVQRCEHSARHSAKGEAQREAHHAVDELHAGDLGEEACRRNGRQPLSSKSAH